MAEPRATAVPAATAERVPLLLDLCQWINDLPASQALNESEWAFPIVESVHVLALALMVGTVALVDLRLLGLTFRRVRVSDVAGQLLPLTWIGFAIMALSGIALFASEAAKLYDSSAFRLKLVLLVLAGLNPLIFHFTIYRSVATWDEAPVVPLRARISAVTSLTLWAGIIAAGRMIAYFH